MTVKASLKKRCNQCKFIRRRGRLLIRCVIRRHNQRQG